METVYSGSYSESMNVKNLLQNININVFVQNEVMANIEPWTVSSGGTNPIVLQVSKQDFEKAKSLIEDFENGKLAI
jgi:Putative prokaryotic signal transducing protein